MNCCIVSSMTINVARQLLVMHGCHRLQQQPGSLAQAMVRCKLPLAECMR